MAELAPGWWGRSDWEGFCNWCKEMGLTPIEEFVLQEDVVLKPRNLSDEHIEQHGWDTSTKLNHDYGIIYDKYCDVPRDQFCDPAYHFCLKPYYSNGTIVVEVSHSSMREEGDKREYYLYNTDYESTEYVHLQAGTKFTFHYCGLIEH